MTNDEKRSDSPEPNHSSDRHQGSQVDRTGGLRGETLQHIDAVFAEGAAVLSALAAAGKLGYNVYEGSGTAPDPAKPLLISVLATRTTEDSHDLVLLINNLGVHGVYVDDISVTQPKGVPVQAVMQKEIPRDYSLLKRHPWERYGTGGFGYSSSTDEKNPAEALPIFVAANEEVCLVVQIKQFDERRLEKKPYGKLELEYAVSGVAKSGLSETIEFSVRQSVESLEE